jgi:hypothetical protein
MNPLMTEEQQEELLRIAGTIVVFWKGIYSPKNWSDNMEHLSKWMDSYLDGEPKGDNQ